MRACFVLLISFFILQSCQSGCDNEAVDYKYIDLHMTATVTDANGIPREGEAVDLIAVKEVCGNSVTEFMVTDSLHMTAYTDSSGLAQTPEVFKFELSNLYDRIQFYWKAGGQLKSEVKSYPDLTKQRGTLVKSQTFTY